MSENDPVPAETAIADGRGPAEALLCFNLYAASHAFIRLYTPYLERMGLTYPQFLVLLTLHDTGGSETGGSETGGAEEGMGVGALGAALSMETNTLSPLLKRMTAAGLLSRERSPRDERRVVVRLTDRGRAVAAEAAEVPQCIARENGMDEAGYHETLGVLRRLRREVEEIAAGQKRRT